MALPVPDAAGVDQGNGMDRAEPGSIGLWQLRAGGGGGCAVAAVRGRGGAWLGGAGTRLRVAEAVSLWLTGDFYGFALGSMASGVPGRGGQVAV